MRREEFHARPAARRNARWNGRCNETGMKQKMKVPIGALTTALAAMVLFGTAQPFTAGQTLQTERVMRQKLDASQQLLAAVVTSDWVALDRHARRLDALTSDPGWDVMRLPEFARQAVPFQRALRSMAAAAGQRDQRAALAAYTDLVRACVECHQYVSRARIARPTRS
jgi:hypothetical protein